MLSWLQIYHLFSAFAEDEEEEPESVGVVRSTSLVMEADLVHVEWLQELPEDLDVCIAQRDFEGAVNLINRGKATLLLTRFTPYLETVKT